MAATPCTRVFSCARIEEEAGRLKSAAKLLNKIDDLTIADKSLRLRIQWYRAWTNRKLGRWEGAASQLANLSTQEELPAAVARDRFWLGRTLAEMGKQKEAELEFMTVIESDPLGYYGALAARELNLKLPALSSQQLGNVRGPASAPVEPPPTETRGPASDDDALAPKDRLAFEWLIATDEQEMARSFLETAIPRSHSSTRGDRRSPSLFNDYARAGAYQILFARIAELTPGARKELLNKQPEIVFPRPWAKTIENAAKDSSVAPELIYAIIRQESSFNPDSRSHADAFGLMQVIPEVASSTAASAGVEYRNPEDLLQPEINIRIGAHFLSQTLTKWNGRFIPAVASYNASEKAVLGWLKTRDTRDPVAFIEDIPYEETRNYVKLVIRNYVFYSRLTTSETEISFPEWCLAGLQGIKF